MTFVKNVYIIVSIQFFLNSMLAYLSERIESINQYVYSEYYIIVLFVLVMQAVLLTFIYCKIEYLKEHSKATIVLLVVFIIGNSYIALFVATFLSQYTVVETNRAAFILFANIMFINFSLILYVKTTKSEYRKVDF